MTVSRFVELIAFILIPIALIREVWWSRVLFDKPWNRARPEGAEALDWGQLSVLASGIPAGLVTLVAALAVAFGLSILLPLARSAFLPLVQILALAAAALTLALHPGQGFVVYWILAGFALVSLNLIAAFLLRG